jgi:hypothetical protein
MTQPVLQGGGESEVGARWNHRPEQSSLEACARRLRSLDAQALRLAELHGWRVERSPAAWVSYRPGVIQVAPDETLDADDTLLQIVLHEWCHHMVEGPGSAALPDWGLDNETDADEAHEHAALRFQAWLTSQFGLRWVLMPTTDFRSWYDALPDDPVSGDDASVAMARVAIGRWQSWPLRAEIERLLVRAWNLSGLDECFTAG